VVHACQSYDSKVLHVYMCASGRLCVPTLLLARHSSLTANEAGLQALGSVFGNRSVLNSGNSARCNLHH